MKLEKDSTKIDGCRMRCGNKFCYKSENVRHGTHFQDTNQSLPIIYRVIFIDFLDRIPQSSANRNGISIGTVNKLYSIARLNFLNYFIFYKLY